MKINDKYVCGSTIAVVEQVDLVRGVVWYSHPSTGSMQAERIKVFLLNYQPLTVNAVLERHGHRLPPDIKAELEGLR